MPNDLLLTEAEIQAIVYGGSSWFPPLIAQAQLAKAEPLIRADERAKTLREVAKVFDELCMESGEEKYMCPRCMRQLRDVLKSAAMPEVK